MLRQDKIHSFFFLGIGGIGMSALARYFKSRGYEVSGYDKTPSPLTRELEAEEIGITYDGEINIDGLQGLENGIKHISADDCQVVYTPAVPRDLPLFASLSSSGYDIVKRSQMLGLVTLQQKALCVAGTHGKTTTSTMIAHLCHQSHIGSNAFLGGISNNYKTNLLIDPKSEYVAVEADEYDRSFHQLTPYISVITSADPDHLDIYGTPEAYREAFEHYTSLITHALVVKAGIPIQPKLQEGVKCYTYAGVLEDTQPDFYAANIVSQDGEITFDLCVSERMKSEGIEGVTGLTLGAPVWVNIENSVAAMAVALLCGVTANEIRLGLANYAGVYRRFDRHIKNDQLVYFDDYAHHPEEIRASIASIKRLYPERKMIGIFQPHLFTRTRDFADGFAEVLSQLDELILLPIYPARELPIKGVTSDMLMEKIEALQGDKNTCKVCLKEKAELADYLQNKIAKEPEPVALITIGAGDIDRLVPQITEALL